VCSGGSAAVDESQRELDAALKQLGEVRAALVDKMLLFELVTSPCSATVH
jgi:hypothetical protein